MKKIFRFSKELFLSFLFFFSFVFSNAPQAQLIPVDGGWLIPAIGEEVMTPSGRLIFHCPWPVGSKLCFLFISGNEE